MRTRKELLGALRAARIAFAEVGSADGWLVVAPALGARVLGAGTGEENALWVSPRIARGPWGEGGNAGGARTWIAPETGPRGFFSGTDVALWRVPAEIDPGNYDEIPDGDGWRSWRTALSARAADGQTFPIALTRSVRIEPAPAGALSAGDRTLRIALRATLQNTGPAVIDRRVGLWNIVQVPSASAGTILVPLAPGGTAADLHPYFVDLPAGVLRAAPRMLYLKALGGTRYKVGLRAGACAGRIAFLGRARTGAGGICVALRFGVDQLASYLDKPAHEPGSEGSNGDALQVYSDPGRGEMAFSELEAHAPAARLASRQSQEFMMEIRIAAPPAGGLTAMARTLLR